MPLFEGFPYLVTRVSPAMYHVIVLPDDVDAAGLVHLARVQATANALPTGLVEAPGSALFIDTGGGERRGPPPRGGVTITGRLLPGRVFAETPSLVDRRLALGRFIERWNPKSGYLFGDLSKGGRPATPEEAACLAGFQADGVPRGLARCGRCGERRGRCFDPAPQFSGMVMDVRCRCDNDNRCAACHGLLHERKLNANFFDERDGRIWHVPGFRGLRHRCARAPRDRSPIKGRGPRGSLREGLDW
jgi:hypothetical protein